MTELLLIQPPFWSPFQPPLSLAALTAWLRRAGLAVGSIDLNLSFFEWLLSDECARWLLDSPPANATTRADRDLIAGVGELRDEIQALHEVDHRQPLGVHEVRRHFLVSRWLEAHLAALSRVGGGFTLSLRTGLRWHQGLSPGAIEQLVKRPPRVVATFVEQAMRELLQHPQPAAYGLSCLGQEQLAFTLMLGVRLKAAIGTPVIVGGSYIPRLLESGALPEAWLGHAFDVAVRGQGEVPAEAMLVNLRCGRPLVEGVPGVIHRTGDDLISTPDSEPLPPDSLPVPDFDDLRIGAYLAPAPRLPLLASRGCYWGRCEFCTFARASSARHRPYPVEHILHTVETLSARYGVHHFEFGDEAIPPATLRAMVRTFPDHASSGWAFSSMARFERCLGREDYDGLHRIGFRILQFGLESASERVLGLMGKPTPRETIESNLCDATAAGLWTHTFVFFGFPGERDHDAAETVRFIRDHQESIGSVGAGVFSLEQDARMTLHLDDFGVRARPRGEVSLIHDYDVDHGNGPERALFWLSRLLHGISQVPRHRAASRLLPELGLALLAETSCDDLLDRAQAACWRPRRGQATLRLTCEVLDQLSAMRFHGLSSPDLRDLLGAATLEGPVAAIGAWWCDLPVGVTIARPGSDRPLAAHTTVRPGFADLHIEQMLDEQLRAEVERRSRATEAVAAACA